VTAKATVTFAVAQPDAAATIVAPNVVTVSAADLAAVSGSCKTSITFKHKPAFSVDQIITAGVTPKLPNGLMRRVTKITKSGGGYVVTTAPVALDQVFWQADFEMSDIPLVPVVPTSSATPHAQVSPHFTVGTTLNISQGLSISDGFFSLSGQLQAALSASLTVSIKISSQWKWGSLPVVTLDDFLWRETGSLSVSVTATIAGKAQYTKEVEAAPSIRLEPIVLSILPPVVIVPTIESKYGLGLSLGDDLKFGVAATSSMAAGFEYKDGVYTNLSNSHMVPSVTLAPDGGPHASGTAKIYVKVAVVGYIDLIAGPDIASEAGIEFTGQLPCPGKVTVSPYLEVTAGAEVNLFTKTLQYEESLIKISLDLVDRGMFHCDLAIKTTTLPDGQVGDTYAEEVEADGGTKPYSWEATGLPPGLEIDDDGMITGTPTEDGTYQAEFTVTDSSGDDTQGTDDQEDTKVIPITITSGLRVVTTSLPDATVDIGYGTTLEAANGVGDLTWEITSGDLPDGIELDPDGTISGTASDTAVAFFTVTVTDGDGNTATASLSLTVDPKLPDPVNGDPIPPPTPPACIGECGGSFGDPHLTTFDGVHYDFQQVGEFVAVKSDLNDLQIQIRQRPFNGSRQVAGNCAVAFEVAGHRVGIYLQDDGTTRTLVDGQPVTVSSSGLTLSGGGTVTEPNGTYEVVTWPDGSFVAVDSAGRTYLGLSLSLSQAQRGHVTGLFGNADGDPANDLATRDGVVLTQPATPAQLYGAYSASWRISQAESLFDYATGESTATFTDLAFPYGSISIDQLPDANRQAAIAACTAAGIPPGPLFDACVLDVALSGDLDAATAAAIAAQSLNSGTAPIGLTCDATSVAANDDGSSPEIALPFTVNFGGRQFSSLWVNNNGNITFDGPLSAYTSSDLSTTGSAIVAGWWADVDTRGANSDPVKYGTGTVNGRQAFCATYDNVGYYAGHDDKLNSFQIYIVDRSDVAAGAFDIVFQYQKLLWETGDASGGINGLGGVSATVGYSNGQGTYMEMPGSRVPGSFLDGAPGSLVTGSHNAQNEPGVYVYPIR
jgi:hypothetical protein